MEDRVTYLVRVWLPDRPGALGAVASRLGALQGDVTALEIVERGGGSAVDELVVELPADVPVNLIAREIAEEDGVEVEAVDRLDDSRYDPQLDVLEAAAILLGAESGDELAEALCEHVCRAIRSDWACVLDRDGAVIGSKGERPNTMWLQSFVSGSPSIDRELGTVEMDTVWVPMASAEASLVVGRDVSYRSRERQRLAALARIADAWFRRLRERSRLTGLLAHPSRT